MSDERTVGVVPPQNVEAEEFLLGSILTEEKILVDIIKFEHKKFGIILNKKNNNEPSLTQEKFTNNEKYNIGDKVKVKITEIKDFGVVGENVNSKIKNSDLEIIYRILEIWNTKGYDSHGVTYSNNNFSLFKLNKISYLNSMPIVLKFIHYVK